MCVCAYVPCSLVGDCVSVQGASQGMIVTRNLLYRMSLPLQQYNAFHCSYTSGLGLHTEAWEPNSNQKEQMSMCLLYPTTNEDNEKNNSKTIIYPAHMFFQQFFLQCVHVNLCACTPVVLVRKLWVEVEVGSACVYVCVCVCVFCMKSHSCG